MDCLHEIFIENLCSKCKRARSDCKDVVTLPFNYIHPGVNLSLAKSAIDRCRSHDLESLLVRKKLHLVLDLDNTLVHSKKIKKKQLQQHVSEKKDGMQMFVDGDRLVRLRPGAHKFIEEAKDMFDLSIYTMGTRDYGHRIANILGKGDGRSLFGRIIGKEDCTTAKQKGLDVVLSDKRVVVIVDDKEEVWEDSCKANVIEIVPYRYFSDNNIRNDKDDDEMDDGLKKVLSTLKLVHLMFYATNNNNIREDVRQVLQRIRPSEDDTYRVATCHKRSLQETHQQNRIFIEKFCAPLKRYKTEHAMAATGPSPCLAV